ncbi:MAG: four helix bundle protein [Bryobacteraceae bacterium]
MRNLEIWRSGLELVKRTYETTRAWPKEELYGLTTQVRRAAVSVPANIAEGVGRGTPREAARFSQIALGSLYELDTLFEVADQLEFAVPSELRQTIGSLIRQTWAFTQHQRNNVRRSEPQATRHKPQAATHSPPDTATGG